MVNVLGYDIGGANTKAAFITTKKGKLQNSKVAVQYFPIWKEPEKLAGVLLEVKKRLNAVRIDGVGITMTAELSDVYSTKREGVHQILSCVKRVFPNLPIFVLNTDVILLSFDAAYEVPLKAAAANWAATGWLVAHRIKDCVIVDVGSTSTSIIPIVDAKVVAKGKTDLDKLLCGELVYTGSLRTNAATIVHSIPIKNGVAQVASELFALSADVHLALGNITEKEYICDTADGRERTLAESFSRLARVVCADTEMLTQKEIVSMANYICNKQIAQVTEGLSKVYSFTKNLTSRMVPVVVTGLGKDFIARKAAEKIDVDCIIDLGTLIQNCAVMATPAFGVALMVATKIEGEIVNWTPQ
ncbi:MAG TPA: hydantoinase/oxoprolinase family protein [Candidatus Acidoferrum sp.]|nr:hydantoinase/oxoprolinase family protein [Candidatus Acidoferrum sp.]